MSGPNFGWSYPPGVSGNESAIAGADYERELEKYPCPNCGDVLLIMGYRFETWLTCSGCDFQEDLEPPERDPDEERERMREVRNDTTRDD